MESTTEPLAGGWRRALAALDRAATRPEHRFGLRAWRVTVGLVVLYQILINYGQRDLVYGPDAAYPFDLFAENFGSAHISLLVFGSSSGSFEFIYHACLFIIVAWTLGLATWLTTPLTFLAVHSLHERCHGLWDGGDNITLLLLIYAMFMNVGPREDRGAADAWWRPYRNILHNSALLACMVQVCIVYFVAGAAKLPGKYWQNGTSFYYVLNSAEFGVTSWGPFFWDNPLLLAGMTWAPVVMQLAFPWVYFFGRPTSRRLVVLVAMSFHAGIFVLMGLESFALLMIAAELLLLSDDDYRWFGAAFGEVKRRARWSTKPGAEPGGT